MVSARARAILLPFASLFALSLSAVACDSGSSSSAGLPADCPSLACASAEKQENTCDNYGRIELGKYRLFNNLWGVGRTKISGQQCVWSNCSEGSAIAWGTNYDWKGGPSGQVESYTAVLMGWHFGETTPDSGLPVQIAEGREISCSWSFQVQQTGPVIQNVAYDIWVSTTADGSSGPSDEIMIWLYRSGASPIGTLQERVKVGDSSWDLYEGPNGNFQVHSFVLTQNSPCATLNVADFFAHLVDKRGLDSSKYIIGIEAGSEVFSGEGQLDTVHYSCDVL